MIWELIFLLQNVLNRNLTYMNIFANWLKDASNNEGCNGRCCGRRLRRPFRFAEVGVPNGVMCMLLTLLHNLSLWLNVCSTYPRGSAANVWLKFFLNYFRTKLVWIFSCVYYFFPNTYTCFLNLDKSMLW